MVICVSFRIAASAEAPLTPMLFPSRLCERGENEYKRLSVSRGAHTKANAWGGGTHLSEVIFVSLRMAASAEAPLAPMTLPKRLRSAGEVGAVREHRRVKGH